MQISIYKMRQYFTYITSNPGRTVLYTGVTNNLERRMAEHFDARGNPATFAGKYYCYDLVYWETTPSITGAIAREKEIKGWTRAKKDALIASQNPTRATLKPWL